MKKLKKSFVLMLVLTMLSALTIGCEKSTTEPNEVEKEVEIASTEKPLEGKHLRLAINATFPPFESVQIVNGKTNYIGMDLDLVDNLSDKLGFTYEITDMSFAGLVGALQTDRADFVCSGISPTEERLESIDFSVSYYYPGIAVISKKDSQFTDIESIKGKTIIVGFGTTYENWAMNNIEGAEVKAMDGTPAVVQEVKIGRGEAGILDANQAAEFIKENPELQFNVLEYDRSKENSFAIAFQKDSELVEIFDAELNKMLENGEMDELIVKWCGEEFAN